MRATAAASACSSSWAATRTTLPSDRAERSSAGCSLQCEHVRSGGDDLRRAAVVDGQSHHLDTREAVLDIDQQRGVAAVEAVDRLRRVADEVQVVMSGAEQIEQLVLERVQVLRLVDQDVTEPPPLGLGVVGVALERVERQTEQVVEVDDLACLLVATVCVERFGDDLRGDRGAVLAPACG